MKAIKNILFLSATTAAAITMLWTQAAHGLTGDLVAFLERAERMCSPNRVLAITITEDGKPGGDAAEAEPAKSLAIIDPGAQAGEESDGENHRQASMFFASGSGDFRSLTPLAWGREGKRHRSGDRSPQNIGVDDPLGSSDLRSIDFFPFWKTDYAKTIISDQKPGEKTVSIYADEGRPYTLYVITFDTEKLVPRVIRFYRDNFRNLVRIRNDDGYVMVGARPRPTKITIRDYVENTTRSYHLEWRELDSSPQALMDLSSFATAPLPQ